MKSLKKTLVLLVVFSMILSTLVPAFAATDVEGLDCEDQVTRMEALGIIKGFEDDLLLCHLDSDEEFNEEIGEDSIVLAEAERILDKHLAAFKELAK